MDVSVIIVGYNSRELLRDCIASIEAQTSSVVYEVIVVDNASSDGTADMLRAQFPQVQLVESGYNSGFGVANNLGIEAASGKYLFLLNPDTLLRNNAIKLLLDYAEASDERLGCVGCMLESVDGEPNNSYNNFSTLCNTLGWILSTYVYRLRRTTVKWPGVYGPLDVDFVLGADMFVPRRVLDAIGVFDPRFFMYCEEMDLQRRMALAGYRRTVIPGPRIVHLEGGGEYADNGWSYARRTYSMTSTILYIKKYYNPLAYGFFRVSYALLMTPKILVSNLSGKEKRGLVKLLFS